MKYLFMDTSGLMHAYNELNEMIKEEQVKLVVCSTVLEELDNHKDGDNSERKFKARKALALLNNNPDSVIYVIDEVPNKFVLETLFYGFDMDKPDNKILYACYCFMESVNDAEVVLATNDNGIIVKCNTLNIPSIKMLKAQEDEIYRGYIELYGTEEENDNALLDLMDSETLHANQYVILHDLDTDTESAVRWNAELGDFVDIKYRSTRIKPFNIYQACALDLLYDDNIPVKVIVGQYGSGKTILTMKMMEEKIKTGLYDKLLLCRNPIAVDDYQIGILPGGIVEKIGHYFLPLLQYLDNNTMCDDLAMAFNPMNEEFAKQRGYQIDMQPIQHLKGISVDRTIMVIDEAQDTSLKLIKVAGTRIGKGSIFVMMGDIKNQTEDKYKHNNGLASFIEQTKDEPYVGVVYLNEDVRSSVSKMFASLK